VTWARLTGAKPINRRIIATFMFRLTNAEAAMMRSQIATSSKRRIKYQPLVFTELGVVMLSSVLNSPRAIQMSIMVVAAFVRLREMIAANKDIATLSRNWNAAMTRKKGGP
jgi:hypothetical protein